MGVEENVLQSGKKTISQDLSSPFFLFLISCSAKGGTDFRDSISSLGSYPYLTRHLL